MPKQIITLKQFLNIVNGGLIDPWICQVYIRVPDEEYGGEQEILVKFNGDGRWLEKLENLEPYYEYEIVKLYNHIEWGEIADQHLILREITTNRTEEV